MTVYAQSDVESVSVSGTGHSHVRKEKETHMKVTCPACEPELKRMGWSTSETSVPLTFDEAREADQADREIAAFQVNDAKERSRAAAGAVRGSVASSRRGQSK